MITTQLNLYPTLIYMIQKKIYIYMLHEDLRKFRLPIITIEGYKDRAALLKLLINYF